MRFLYKLFFVLFFVTAATSTFATKTVSPGWALDENMGFQLGYFPPTNSPAVHSNEDTESPPSLNLNKIYLPDISNVHLDAFLKLGVRAPTEEPLNQYNAYFKLYRFPNSFIPANTTVPILFAYHLDQLQNGKELMRYVSKRKNTVVKVGCVETYNFVFSPKHPFPKFVIGRSDSSQWLFNKNISFVSLYVLPSKQANKSTRANELAKLSQQGLINFHHNLIEVYKKDLRLIPGKDKKYWYFVGKNIPTAANKLILFMVPKETLRFQNWRATPMPQDPKHIFLTGHVLIHRIVYKTGNNLVDLTNVPKIGSEAFNKIYKAPGKATMFEIGSTLYLHDSKQANLKFGTFLVKAENAFLNPVPYLAKMI
jgi:hypothetical protein